jgi:hypothetical protein
VASSARPLLGEQRTAIVLKDSTQRDTVGLEPDEALTRITISAYFVPCHIQFHRLALP